MHNVGHTQGIVNGAKYSDWLEVPRLGLGCLQLNLLCIYTISSAKMQYIEVLF